MRSPHTARFCPKPGSAPCETLVPPLLGWTRLAANDAQMRRMRRHASRCMNPSIIIRLCRITPASKRKLLSLCFHSFFRFVLNMKTGCVSQPMSLIPFCCHKQSVSRVLFRLCGDNHLSRHDSCLPAQATLPGRFRGPHHPFPIWSCSVWGLPKPASHLTAGALLPHLSTLACKAGGLNLYGTFPKVTLAGRYPAHCPVEPGLSSSA